MFDVIKLSAKATKLNGNNAGDLDKSVLGSAIKVKLGLVGEKA